MQAQLVSSSHPGFTAELILPDCKVTPVATAHHGCVRYDISCELERGEKDGSPKLNNMQKRPRDSPSVGPSASASAGEGGDEQQSLDPPDPTAIC